MGVMSFWFDPLKGGRTPHRGVDVEGQARTTVDNAHANVNEKGRKETLGRRAFGLVLLGFRHEGKW
jgi:hypothetical protein